jgi:hypothetical protein
LLVGHAIGLLNVIERFEVDYPLSDADAQDLMTVRLDSIRLVLTELLWNGLRIGARGRVSLERLREGAST